MTVYYSRYIDHLTKYRTAIRTWLERAVMCLQLITNQMVKMEYALSIAKLAPVPWPVEMNPIIELRSLSHSYAKEIDQEYKMQQVKMLRVKYGWSMDSKEDDTKFVLRMVTQNRDDLLTDLEIFKKFTSKIFETNFYCVYYLAFAGHIHKAQQYLQTLSDEEAKTCYYKIARITPQTIGDSMHKTEIYENWIELLRFVMHKDIGQENREQINDIMNLHLLKKSALAMSVTTDELPKKDKVEEFLDAGINKLLQVLRTTEKNLADVIWQNVKVLAGALKVNQFDIVFKLEQTVNNIHFTTLLAKIFRDEDVGDNNEYIKMAVTLISQQYRQTLTDSVCLDEIESFAFPMAYLYAQKVKGVARVDVEQLINFAHIGANAFEPHQVQQFLEDNVDKVDSVRNKRTVT